MSLSSKHLFLLAEDASSLWMSFTRSANRFPTEGSPDGCYPIAQLL
jgi:hypothetical protein